MPCLVHFENIGCRLNQTETEALASAFLKHSFRLYAGKDADCVCLVFINTCTVTGKADQKCRRLIRLCVKKFPNALILVSGCYAQLNAPSIEKIHRHVKTFPGLRKGQLCDFPEYLERKLVPFIQADAAVNADVIMRVFAEFKNSVLLGGNHACEPARQRMAGLSITQKLTKDSGLTQGQETASVKTLIPSSTQIPQKTTADENTPIAAFALNTETFHFHSRASLKIQDGCNSACSFCTIHLARGKAVSLPAAQAVEQARAIEAAGKREIVLTGVNLSQYRDGDIRFPQLLHLLLQNTERVHFRISSFYPEVVDDAFLSVITDRRICPYFHLSVQSGSSRILQLMRRPCDVAALLQAGKDLRVHKPDCFLGADIIAGFPTETEDDFRQTLALCRELELQHIHAFPYSARPGTPAYSMRPVVPPSVAQDRVGQLTALSEKQYRQYRAAMTGKIFFGIVEDFADGKKVLTENYLLLPLKKEKFAENVSGSAVTVRVLHDGCEIIDKNEKKV